MSIPRVINMIARTDPVAATPVLHFSKSIFVKTNFQIRQINDTEIVTHQPEIPNRHNFDAKHRFATPVHFIMQRISQMP